MSDEQIDVLSEALMPYFDELEQWVIQDIARRLDETLTYSGTIENELAAMKRLGYSPAKMRREVMRLLAADKNLKKYIAQQTAEYKRAYAEMMEKINRDAAKAGADMIYRASDIAQAEDRKIWNEAGKKLKEGDFLHQLSDVFGERMEGDLVNLTRTSGFKAGMSYVDARQAYTHSLNNSVLRMASGVSTIEREVTSVIHEMAKSGLRSVNYTANRSQHIESAVRTALRTTYSQLSGAVMDRDIKQTGESLVYVSQHWGARNKGEGIENHEEWQGKVYKLDDREYPEEEKRIGQKITGLVEATGYDAATSTVMDPRGLHGYNCRHSHYAWFEGVSEKPKYKPEPPPKEIDGKVYDYYAMTQKMRRMEREIRAMRKELIALKDLNMDAEQQQELKKDISKKLNEYQNFCDKCSIPPKYERTRVEKVGTDIKKTRAYKDYEKMEREAQEKRKSEKTGENIDELRSIEGISQGIKDLKAALAGKEAKTVRQMEKNLAELSGIPLKKIKMTGLQYDTSNMIYSSCKKVLDIYPELKDQLSSFEYDGIKGSAYASCKPITGAIRVHEKFADYDKLVERYAADVASNFHPIGTDHNSIIVHELGHALDGYMTKQLLLDAEINEFKVKRMAHETVYDMTLRYLGFDRQGIDDELRRQGLKNEQISDILDKKEKDFISSHVSKYATKNKAEFFAECFAEYMTSDSPREAAKIFGEIINTALGGRNK